MKIADLNAVTQLGQQRSLLYRKLGVISRSVREGSPYVVHVNFVTNIQGANSVMIDFKNNGPLCAYEMAEVMIKLINHEIGEVEKKLCDLGVDLTGNSSEEVA